MIADPELARTKQDLRINRQRRTQRATFGIGGTRAGSGEQKAVDGEPFRGRQHPVSWKREDPLEQEDLTRAAVKTSGDPVAARDGFLVELRRKTDRDELAGSQAAELGLALLPVKATGNRPGDREGGSQVAAGCEKDRGGKKRGAGPLLLCAR